jgi:hypothetical protein
MPRTLGSDDRVEGALDPVPSVVAVHRPVPPAHGGDEALASQMPLDLGHVARSRPRLDVATVEERVKHAHDPLAVRAVDDRGDVGEERVDSSVGAEPEEVQASAVALRLGDAVADDGVLRERAIDDGVVDARDVHHRDAPRAEVEMTDLAVAHLARRKADVRPARTNQAAWIFCEELGQTWCVGEPHGVVLPRFSLSKPIENDEDERPRRHAARR